MSLVLQGVIGSVTLSEDAPSADYVLALPNENGTVVTSASITANTAVALNATGTAPMYACRAWVNFNGTGTVAIRASGNVSSITDIANGVYEVNYIIGMPDVNYCGSTTLNTAITSGGFGGDGGVSTYTNGTLYTNKVVVSARSPHNNAGTNCALVSVKVFR
jgi:hypothetical protein